MDERYVVAPGVTIEVSATGDEYREGESISPEVFPTIAEFKGFLAAGRIVRYVPPEEPPAPRLEWDYFSIDEDLDAESPNPVSNRALHAAMESAGNGLASEAAERRAADESLSARLDEAEERAREAEETNSGSMVAERSARKGADDALAARIDALSERCDEADAARARAESNLADGVSAEEAARESADDALREMVGAEESRARHAEEEISADVSALDAKLSESERRTLEAAEKAEAAVETERNARESESENLRGELGRLVGNDGKKSVREIACEVAAGVYRPRGSCAFASLPPLSEAEEGDVWNVADPFTTTDDFVEGAGRPVPAGANIVAVAARENPAKEPQGEGEGESSNGEDATTEGGGEPSEVESSENEGGEAEDEAPALKWDVLGGTVDLSGYQPKTLSHPLSGNNTVEDALDALDTVAHRAWLGVVTEESLRTGADKALGRQIESAVSAEAAARTAADDALSERVDALQETVGDLDALKTTAKDSLVSAVNELGEKVASAGIPTFRTVAFSGSVSVPPRSISGTYAKSVTLDPGEIPLSVMSAVVDGDLGLILRGWNTVWTASTRAVCVTLVVANSTTSYGGGNWSANLLVVKA